MKIKLNAQKQQNEMKIYTRNASTTIIRLIEFYILCYFAQLYMFVQ